MFMQITDENICSGNSTSVITAYLFVQPDGECCTNEVRLFRQ
jgi:hypothetical protein